MNSGYILFPTSAGAFATERLLKSLNIKIKLISTPRHLSSDCGISAYFWDSPSKEVEEILNKVELEFKIVEYKDEFIEAKNS